MGGDCQPIQRRSSFIPAMQNGMGIISYPNYYNYTEKRDQVCPVLHGYLRWFLGRAFSAALRRRPGPYPPVLVGFDGRRRGACPRASSRRSQRLHAPASRSIPVRASSPGVGLVIRLRNRTPPQEPRGHVVWQGKPGIALCTQRADWFADKGIGSLPGADQDSPQQAEAGGAPAGEAQAQEQNHSSGLCSGQLPSLRAGFRTWRNGQAWCLLRPKGLRQGTGTRFGCS